MQIKHYLLTGNGEIQEFTLDQAIHVALGRQSLPEYAGLEARYLQVVVEEPDDNNTLHVKTLGAHVRFDAHGRLSDSGELFGERSLSSFEHDTCVQLALQEQLSDAALIH